MILSRELGKRIWGGSSTNMENGGSGVSSDYIAGLLTGYAKESWVDEHYISIEFFSRLFQAHGTENGSEIDVLPNDMETTITSVESMFGFWTNLYISALGSNGAAPAGISLGMLTDVTITGTPSAGQVLTFDDVSGMWVNGNAQAGVTALANLTDVTLTSLQTNQILVYNGSAWINSSVKTINGYSIFGTGDIPASGGGGGNYLPLAGGTMTGNVVFSSGNISSNNIAIGLNFDPAFIRLSKNVDSYIYMGANNTLHIGANSINSNSGLSIYIPNGNAGIDGSLYTTLGYDCPNETGYKSDGYTILRLNGTGYTILSAHGKNIIFRPMGDTSTTNQLTAYTSGVFNASGFQSRQILIDCDSSGNATYSGEINNFTQTLWLQYTSNKNCEICDGGGNVGIGTTPAYKLHVAGTIYATGAITALSDARKKDITGEAGVTVEQIAHAPAVQFLWKDKERRKDGQQVGTLAQYWQTVLPEVVMDKGGELSMQYGVAALVSAIVTARKVVDHERRIHELEKENERLKKEISQLRLN